MHLNRHDYNVKREHVITDAEIRHLNKRPHRAVKVKADTKGHFHIPSIVYTGGDDVVLTF